MICHGYIIQAVNVTLVWY